MIKISLKHPYSRPKGKKLVWLRGNLHVHSTCSDGRRTPQDVIDDYSHYKHDFLGFSDHDRISDFTGLKNRGMILLPGNEISAHGVHLLDVGARTHIKANRARQKVIDAINKKSGFAVINHPNWTENFNHCTMEQLLALKNYQGIEIFNGSCVAEEGSAYALEKWDQLLSTGRIVWGFANDDSHVKTGDNLGWNVVRVPAGRVNASAILAALRSGNFYASTGVELTDIRTEGTVIHIDSRNAVAYELIGDHGQAAAFVRGRSLTFDVSRFPMTYIRVQVYGAPREYAWTQPFILSGMSEHLNKLLKARPVLRNGRWDAFRYMGRSALEPTVKTELRCTVTEKQLLFDVVCHETRMDRLKKNERNGSTQLWSDDSLELFIQPNLREKGYFQIMANAAGHTAVLHTLDNRPCPTVECQVELKKDCWKARISVERALLKASGRLLGFHAARNRKAGAIETYFWSFTGGKNHRPEYFGRLDAGR